MLFSVQTPAAGGTAFAQFAAAWCYDGNGYILNDTGTSLDVRIGASGSIQTLAAGGTLPIKLVYSMAELYVRRTDQSTTQVTVEAQVGTGSAGGGGSTADMGVIAAAAVAGHDTDSTSHVASSYNMIQGMSPWVGARNKVQVGYGSCIAFIGDSTWVQGVDYPMPRLLAGAAGEIDDCDAYYQEWDDTTQTYLPRTTEHVSSFPGYFEFNSAQAGTIRATGAPLTTNALEIIVELYPDSWTPGSSAHLVGQWDSAPAYHLMLLTSGKLYFEWHTGSVAESAASSAAVTVGVGFKYVRCTFFSDGAGRAINFYESPDGSTWTQIGAQITGAASTIRASSSDKIEVGAVSGTYSAFSGKIRRVIIRDAVNGGHNLMPDSLGAWTVKTVHPNEFPRYVGRPSLLVLNASQPNANFAYWSNAARLTRAISGTVDSVLVGLGHNDYDFVASDHNAALYAIRDAIASANASAFLGFATQNPRVSWPRKQYNAMRNANLAKFCSLVGYPFVDFCAAWVRRSGGYSSLLVDDVHPSQAGHDFYLEPARTLWIRS